MSEITRATFEELRSRLIDALRPHLTRMETSLLSGALEVGDDSLFAKSPPFDTIYFVDDYDMDDPTLRLEDIYVEDSRRGQGLGSVVIRTFLEFSREKGLDANLSANPPEDVDDPGREAAKERLFAYYERFGMTNDGFGNMEVRLDRTGSPEP